MKNRLAIILLTVVALFAVGTSIFLYTQYQKSQALLNNPVAAGQLEAKELIKKISRLMVLPEKEEPTVATVSDYKKLKDQPFFKNAHNGDKVLIYTKAAIAVLYDPKLDKILAVMPVTLGSNSQVAGSSSEAPLKIALYNGTETPGLTNTIDQQLTTNINNVSISTKVNAAKTDYQSTIVVALTPKGTQAASQVAGYLKAAVADLPEGESKPAAGDILIIIGRDKSL